MIKEECIFVQYNEYFTITIVGTMECRTTTTKGDTLIFDQIAPFRRGHLGYWSMGASICKRSNETFLVSFNTCSHVIEIAVNPLKEIQTYKTELRIRCIEYAQHGGQEILFVGHYDGILRSYSLRVNTMKELAQMMMAVPQLILWDNQREILFVDEQNQGFVINSNSNVRMLSVAKDARALKVVNTINESKFGITILSWCLSGENTLLCFDGSKDELVEFEIK